MFHYTMLFGENGSMHTGQAAGMYGLGLGLAPAAVLHITITTELS